MKSPCYDCRRLPLNKDVPVCWECVERIVLAEYMRRQAPSPVAWFIVTRSYTKHQRFAERCIGSDEGLPEGYRGTYKK